MFETDVDAQEEEELMIKISTTFILITHGLPGLVPIYLHVNFLDFFTSHFETLNDGQKSSAMTLTAHMDMSCYGHDFDQKPSPEQDFMGKGGSNIWY